MTVVTNSRYDASSASVVGAGSRLVRTSTKPAARRRSAVVSASRTPTRPSSRRSTARTARDASRARPARGRAARLGPPPHCANSRPPGRRAREDAAKERVVIANPVERRGAEDEVGPGVERQSRQVDLHERHARAERRAAGSRARSAACSTIDRSRSAGRAEPRHQLAGEPAGAAAGVDDALVALRASAGSRTRCPHAVCGADDAVVRAAFHSRVTAVAGMTRLAGSAVCARHRLELAHVECSVTAMNFPPTRLSVVARTRSEDQETRRLAFETLIEAYWKPVYKYLRLKWQLDPDDGRGSDAGVLHHRAREGRARPLRSRRTRALSHLPAAVPRRLRRQRAKGRRRDSSAAAACPSCRSISRSAEGEIVRHEPAVAGGCRRAVLSGMGARAVSTCRRRSASGVRELGPR